MPLCPALVSNSLLSCVCVDVGVIRFGVVVGFLGVGLMVTCTVAMSVAALFVASSCVRDGGLCPDAGREVCSCVTVGDAT